MKKIFKSLTVAAFGVLMLFALAACGNNIDNVKFISAKYGTVMESQIYPSNLLNAMEVEQVYKRWDIVVADRVTVEGISFKLKLADGEKLPKNMSIRICKVSGQSAAEIITVEVTDYVNDICFETPVAFSTGGDILQMAFSDGDGENTSIKFRIEGFTLKTC